MYFRGLYEFYFVKLLDAECLLSEVKDEDLDIDHYRKHIMHFQNAIDKKCTCHGKSRRI